MLLLHMLHTEENFQLHPRSVNGGMGLKVKWGQCDEHLIRRGGGILQTYRMNTQMMSVRED